MNGPVELAYEEVSVSFLLQMIPALLVLGVLIFIHELGHFLACKYAGVRVDRFSIGFGPEILHYQGRETRYALSLIPLGGFVKPSGETNDEVSKEGLRPYDFLAQGWGKRFFIGVAGILMNFVLAYALFFVVFLMGRPVLAARVGGFVEGYPAATSGLEIGDLAIRVDGAPVVHWRELTDRIYQAGPREVELVVMRGDRLVTVRIMSKVEEARDIFGTKMRVGRIGILPGDEFSVERYGPLGAIAKAGDTLLEFTGFTFKAIGHLLTGKLSLKSVSGPIGIFSITSKTAQMGSVHLLQLTAILSISLAVFNLIPLPPLDGGLLLFTALEAVRRKQLSFRVQDAITRTGYVLLLTLMIVVMYNDLSHIEFFTKLKNLVAP